VLLEYETLPVKRKVTLLPHADKAHPGTSTMSVATV
jgi:hypothetical protein